LYSANRLMVTFRVLPAVLLATLPLLAQREPVLKQIDLPHPYYFREMYLPQLTTGPSAAAWMPDSQTLIYSMAGDLWKQKLGSDEAQQITAGAGYDYQPDVSHDGHWVVYTCYLKDAMELWVLDLTNGNTRQLTSGGAVNVEPRFSPDGKRIAFVSTSYHGHFHIFAGDFADGELKNVQRLTGETRSDLPRYYYSPFDHEISPAWSRDGKEILFVSNHGHIYGTGGFWRMKAEPDAEAHEIHYEETTWKARPDFSSDGKRIVYASYLGQQWHQLWLMPSDGGDALELSYDQSPVRAGRDNINPRWSPDGKKIAYISNGCGNTCLQLQEFPGAAPTSFQTTTRRYLKSMGSLSIKVLDPSSNPTPTRIFVTSEDGRASGPRDALMHADDSYDRSERPFEAHYFHSSGSALLDAPAGKITVTVMKGFEYEVETRTVSIAKNKQTEITIKLKALDVPSESRSQWVSGDVHVHMNYGGAYRNAPKGLVSQASAENLGVVEDLIVNKEQRIPDISYFVPGEDEASTGSTHLFHGQEFHTSYWGHLGLLNLSNHFLLPGYAAYAGTAAASLYPMNADIADLAHAQNALVGYVHPYDVVPDPAHDTSLTHELPVDLALGKVDYIEVMGFSDHKSTADIWYRLLNLGFHLPTAAGTDAMANFASLRGPVGLNRVYAQVPEGNFSINSWLDSIKRGHTFATNGPLIGFSLGDQAIGGELKLPSANNKVKFTAWMRSIVPVDHLQIVCNGNVVRDLTLTGSREAGDFTGVVPISQTGWCLLRAWSEKAEFPILDTYPYATTSPIYVTVAHAPARSPEDATYFVGWIDRMTESVNSNRDWNTETEKQHVLETLSRAREIYAEKAK
jgi:TolB protein